MPNSFLPAAMPPPSSVPLVSSPAAASSRCRPIATSLPWWGSGCGEDGTGFSLDVALAVTLPGLEPALAAELVEEAGIVCPYSHLTRNGLALRVSLAA